MRKSLLAVAVLCLSVLPCAAKADTFNFSASALGSSTSGVITATNNNDGSYTVTDITGTGIVGLIAAGDPFFNNDNLLFPASTRVLDVNGLAFTANIAGQVYSVDLFSNFLGTNFLALDSNSNLTFDTATFSLSRATVTPEPSSLLLLVTGLLGTGTAVVRRRMM